MSATSVPYKIYMVFENENVEGKYIPLLYSASDELGEIGRAHV